jgi:aryl-alcohol dehydrogenase-like predicted oxidoreductase
MQYKRLGRSDLNMSEIGFGCMSLGSDYHPASTILHHAVDNGINFFDTANIYDKGNNEEIIGRAFTGIRSKVILATKVGNQWRSDGSGLDWNPGRDHILQSVEQSLTRLRTDYIDLYQLHGGTIKDPIDETIEAFETLKRAGKIRHYGISSIRPNVIKEYIKRSDIVSVMMQYSLLDRRPEEECLDLLYKNEIGVLARGSLASGLLVDKPAKAYLKYTAAEVQKASETVAGIANEKRSKTSAAIRFVLHHSAITSAVIGIRTMEQLKEALQPSNSTPLTVSEIQELQQAIVMNQYQEHR